MDSYDVYFSFALAAAAGLLIGIEREQSAPRDEDAGTFTGIFLAARTNTIVKGIIAATLGTAAYRRRIGIAFAIVLAAGAAAVLFAR